MGDTASARALETPDFSNACQRFLRVSWRGEETGALTGNRSRYFNPFTARYPYIEGADYAIGTMWTRCETWRNSEQIIDFETVSRGRGTARRIVFTQDYVDRILEGLGGRRIPALPLAAYLFRRPDDSQVDVAGVASLADLGTLLREVFSITERELDLFDFSDPAPRAPDLSAVQMTRREALAAITAVVPVPAEGATEEEDQQSAPVPARTGETIAVNWGLSGAVDENPCGLVGQGDTMRKALAALEARKHIVLVGPPGTGKTELAVCICDSLGTPFDVVTATSDWTTFDTIGGYFPHPGAGDGGGPGALDFSPGVVSQSLLNQRWIVVDELNRADVDKAFGELFTLLSGKTVRLPFKKREGGQLLDVVLGATAEAEGIFSIPLWDEWRILGTMNTFDKASLFQLSYAFMRRFAFVEVPIPTRDQYQSILRRKAEALTSGGSDAFHSETLALIENLFTPQEDQGLAALGLLVGPAIPLDILGYVEKRVAHGVQPPPSNVVLEGVEMYLYPQFEGKEGLHREIVNAIRAALDLDDEATARTGRALATWTGFEVPAG